MKGTHAQRRKSKSNPMGLCNHCGKKIINRVKNALYCKDCADIHQYTQNILGNAIYKSRTKYPNLNIKYKLKLFITKNGKTNI